MDLLLQPQAWLAFVTLLSLEIVLGVDNIVFISILASRLPVHQQRKARLVGLALAMFMRILLLLSLSWVICLTAPWFSIFGQEISGRDLILIGGGLFLIAKATHEIHQKLEGDEVGVTARAAPTFAAVPPVSCDAPIVAFIERGAATTPSLGYRSRAPPALL